MSFFTKLKDRLFKSSSQLDEGLADLVAEAPPETAAEPAAEPAAAPAASPAASPAPAPVQTPTPEPARPGLIGRLFGQTAAPDEDCTPKFAVKVEGEQVFLDTLELASHATTESRPLAGPCQRTSAAA